MLLRNIASVSHSIISKLSLLALFFAGHVSCSSFFVYNWPQLINQYANHSDRHHNTHGVEFPEWTQFYGAGRSVNKKVFEHKTSQFSLFKTMYERAMIDPHRTTDPKEASSFIIPYDLSMDAMFTKDNGRMRKTHCPLANEAMQLLRQSTYFNASYGHNHVLIISGNQNMNYFYNSKACSGMLKLCWNCTKLCIDDYLFLGNVKGNRSIEMANRGINWHAVPFPSDYHFDSSSATVSSSSTIAAAAAAPVTSSSTHPLPWQQPSTNRSMLMTFFGSAKSGFHHSIGAQMRESLTAQCVKHPDHCLYGTHKQDHEHHEVGGHNAAFRDSLFCLLAPGDFPTRKTVFDAILSGCVPVFFHPLSARFMYEWHFSQKEWEEVGVHYDTLTDLSDLLTSKVDFVLRLVEYAKTRPSEIAKKRQLISDLAFKLQYSLIHYHDKTGVARVSTASASGSDSSSGIISASQSPPPPHHHHHHSGKLLDAYDLTMNNVLAIHSGLASHRRVSDFVTCAVEIGAHDTVLQTHDWCSSTGSNVDPFQPSPLVDVSRSDADRYLPVSTRLSSPASTGGVSATAGAGSGSTKSSSNSGSSSINSNNKKYSTSKQGKRTE